MELFTNKEIVYGLGGLVIFLAGILYRLIIDYFTKIFDGIDERLSRLESRIDNFLGKHKR